MTIREIRSTVSTANYATYTIEQWGSKYTYKNVHYSEIPARLKDAEVFIATPTDVSFCAVTHWHIFCKR